MSMDKMNRRLRTAVIWGGAGLTAAAAAAACVLRGLFFAREMYGLMTLWFGLCAAAAAVCLFAGWRQARVPACPAQPAISKPSVPAPFLRRLSYSTGEAKGGQRADNAGIVRGTGNAAFVAAGCLLLILALYAVQLLREPLSVLGTLNELLRWGLYAGFAFFAALCAGSRRGVRFLEALWTMLGMTICLSGLLAVCGGLPVPFAIAYTASPAVSVTGARLAGLLQYPNAFGAVMAVFLLERAIAAAADEDAAGTLARGPLRARQLLRMLPLFPYAAALLLSESRGAMLAAACAAAAAVLLQRQLAVPLLMCAAAPAAAAALLYRQLARTGLAAEPARPAAAGRVLGRRAARRPVAVPPQPARGGQAPRRHAAGGGALDGGGQRRPGTAARADQRAVPDGRRPRAVLPRRPAPRGGSALAGAGGETWRSAYLAAQSRPYVGSQVHSGYLDFLLNLGIAGSAVLLLMLLVALYIAGRNAPGLLPPMLVILLHGAADFSWTYGLFWLLLFLLAARALAGSPSRRLANREGASGVRRRPIESGTSVQRSGVRELLIATLCFCLIFGGCSFKLWRGEALFRQAARSSDPEARSVLLQKSLRYNPYAPRTAIQLAALLPEKERIGLLHSSLKYSPEDAGLSWLLADSYLVGRDPGRALYWMRRSLDLDRFNTFKWESAAKGMLQMGQHYWVMGDRQRAAASAFAGQELMRGYRLLALYEHHKGPAHNDRGFTFLSEAEEVGAELNRLIAAASPVNAPYEASGNAFD